MKATFIYYILGLNKIQLENWKETILILKYCYSIQYLVGPGNTSKYYLMKNTYRW